jgi:prepilin-type N-terminal cleavage/methylation domain-containing protein
MASKERGFTLVELMMTVGVIGIVCAVAIPITDTSLRVNRLRGDATALRNLVGLAKMRASSQSTRARVRVDLGANTYALEIWDRTGGAWVNDNGIRPLSTGVTFGFGTLDTAPPNTQVTIGMSPECTPGLTAAGAVANTACITFNSRGLPVDADGKLYKRHALYLRGTTGVFATTVTSTPLIRLWSSPNVTAVWTLK